MLLAQLVRLSHVLPQNGESPHVPVGGIDNFISLVSIVAAITERMHRSRARSPQLGAVVPPVSERQIDVLVILDRLLQD